ncbi:unnamed protein product [Prunus brigantina]
MIGCGTRRGKLYYLDSASTVKPASAKLTKLGGRVLRRKLPKYATGLPTKTTGLQRQTTGRKRLCLKATGRLLLPTVFRFSPIPAITLRRRELKRLCLLRKILQLQYHTNHLLRTSFR